MHKRASEYITGQIEIQKDNHVNPSTYQYQSVKAIKIWPTLFWRLQKTYRPEMQIKFCNYTNKN